MNKEIYDNVVIKKLILLLLIIFLSLGTTACLEEKKPADVPITGEWSYYSIEGGGDSISRQIWEDRNRIPQFHSEDGRTFWLTINGEDIYEGKLVPNKDGTYTMIYDEKKEPLYLSIKGDELIISKPGKLKIVFLGDDE